MSRQQVSPFFSAILQLFFGAVVVGGVCGFVYTWSLFDRYEREGRDFGLIYIFLILTSCLVAVGIRGIVFTRREIEDDPDIRSFGLRTPFENIVGGLGLMALGVFLTLLTYWWSELAEQRYIFIGTIVGGAVQALAGASRRARNRRQGERTDS